MLLRLDTENLSKTDFNAIIPDFPGPVFKRGCKKNGISNTTGQLKYPVVNFKEASIKAVGYGSDSSLTSKSYHKFDFKFKYN